MSEPDRPTIFALSSGRPPAAIAVVRLSGNRAGDALKAITGKLPAPRQAVLVRVRDPETKESIDQAVALWFPGPNSETGEDTAEIQLHGGRAVIAGTLDALGKLEGLRPAEAGEFTRRAFENGKLDLTAVEGLADLVMAETQGQRRAALRQLRGALRDRAEDWRARLIKALALVEARIDFSDEADVPEDLVAPALAIARSLADEIEAALADERRGERLRDGLVVAIAGPPNAGKSTLLNRIARREVAIVSPYAGTTRDVIEVHLDLDGWPVTLLDTAGVRETDDPVEMEGVRRAQERAAAADLVLWVTDATVGEEHSPVPGSGRGTAAQAGGSPSKKVEVGSGLGDLSGGAPSGDESPRPFGFARKDHSIPPVWYIRNKIDLVVRHLRSESVSAASGGINGETAGEIPDGGRRTEHSFRTNDFEFNLSASSGVGVDQLLGRLAANAAETLAGAESAVISRERQRKALKDVLVALRRAEAPYLAGQEDVIAEELRAAGQALGRLTGRVDVEDVLDVIFRDFCVGK